MKEEVEKRKRMCEWIEDFSLQHGSIMRPVMRE